MTALDTRTLHDTGSPDAAILLAFAEVQNIKAWAYSYDGRDAGDVIGKLDDAEAQQTVHEAVIEGGEAFTVAGVIARLTNLIPLVHTDRWIDATIAREGVLRLNDHFQALDGHAQQLLRGTVELIRIDWLQRLTAWIDAEEDLSAIGRARNASDAASIGSCVHGKPDPRFSDIDDAVEVAQDWFIDRTSTRLHALIRTLTPDMAAYQQKLEIVAAENVFIDAAPWLLRDVRHLAGCVWQGEI